MAALIQDKKVGSFIRDKFFFLANQNTTAYIYDQYCHLVQADRVLVLRHNIFLIPNHAWCVTEIGYRAGKAGP